MLQQIPRDQFVKVLEKLSAKLDRSILERYGIWATVYPEVGLGFYGVKGSGRPAVEINVPLKKTRTRGLLAQENGEMFLCHNGRLNPRVRVSQDEVKKAMEKNVQVM